MSDTSGSENKRIRGFCAVPVISRIASLKNQAGSPSPVCSDQLSIYQEVLPEISEAGAELIGISTDGSWAHNAFRKHLGLEMTLLSDFHPKGEVSRLYGAYLEEWGTPNRSVVLIDEEGIVRWVHAEETPVTFPPAELIVDALKRL